MGFLRIRSIIKALFDDSTQNQLWTEKNSLTELGFNLGYSGHEWKETWLDYEPLSYQPTSCYYYNGSSQMQFYIFENFTYVVAIFSLLKNQAKARFIK